METALPFFHNTLFEFKFSSSYIMLTVDFFPPVMFRAGNLDRYSHIVDMQYSV